MARIASEALIERLADWGVDAVGLPGDGINGIMEALRRHQDKVRFVLVHHEEAAAFMATAYAKATGKIGVCLATSGPGGIHLLNRLYDAKLDHMGPGWPRSKPTRPGPGPGSRPKCRWSATPVRRCAEPIAPEYLMSAVNEAAAGPPS